LVSPKKAHSSSKETLDSFSKENKDFDFQSFISYTYIHESELNAAKLGCFNFILASSDNLYLDAAFLDRHLKSTGLLAIQVLNSTGLQKIFATSSCWIKYKLSYFYTLGFKVIVYFFLNHTYFFPV